MLRRHGVAIKGRVECGRDEEREACDQEDTGARLADDWVELLLAVVLLTPHKEAESEAEQ